LTDLLTAEAVQRALARVIDPEIRQPITELDMVGGVVVDGSSATVQLKLTIVGCPAADTIERDVRDAAASVAGIDDVRVDVSIMSREEREALTTKLRGNRPKTMQFGPDSLTRIYAVTSGKGGVGKSTLTANLGVALAQRGLRVGIVDADVFGFSIPGILGIAGTKPTQVNDMILPPLAHEVKVISIGMFVEEHTAVSWRGPMLHRTIQQFLTDVFFGDLDILLLDLPPGTGDIAISIGQLLPQAEIIENMAGLAQPDGSILELFGSGGGADTAARLSTATEPVPVLASIPLSVALRRGGDAGEPIVLSTPEEPAARAIADLAAALATRGRGLAGRKLGLSVT
jgi:ATP-binding protein involved in chromosome partitioning